MQNYKIKIAHTFSRAAANYDNIALLQQEVREHLINLLPSFTPKTILDLGSGTGILSAKLATLFPNANVSGIDIANNMIEFSRAKWQEIANLEFICADADCLPCNKGSIDLIISNLMLQWSIDIKTTLGQLYQAIKPNGKLLFSTLGNGSLCELKNAWGKIDDYMHVNNFSNKDEIINCLDQLKFKNIQINTINYYYYFNSVRELMLQLKMLGANNLQSKRRNGLYGKKTFALLQKYYREAANSDILLTQNNAELTVTNIQIPATYEVYYVSATK